MAYVTEPVVNLHNYCSDDIDINMKSYILYNIHKVLNTFVKVSGSARYYNQTQAIYGNPENKFRLKCVTFG